MPTKVYTVGTKLNTTPTTKRLATTAARRNAQRLTQQTLNTPITYMGGTADNARELFWLQEPVIQHAVDSIANEYRINPEALKYRINREGFVDSNIKRRNAAYLNKNLAGIVRGYDLLHSKDFNGIQDFGLDDAATYINKGQAKLINENWYDVNFTNEKGRNTQGATGKDVADNIGIMASMLRMFTDKAKKDFPNASNEDIERYGLAYYNRGAAGGRRWVNNGADGYNFRRRLESAGKKSK